MENMLHLSTERLAELADSEPTSAEREHLSGCAACASERDAHQRLVSLAADERARIAPALTDWSSLSARLRDERLIATPVSRLARLGDRSALRAAAAVLLVAGGVAAGRYTAGAAVFPRGMSPAAARQETGVASSVANATETKQAFRSTEEAINALRVAQREYDRAVTFIAAHYSAAYSPSAPAMYRTRLAAFDEMAETAGQALRESPTDPIMSQTVAWTQSAREATLRQLGSSLPEGKRLTRF